MRPEAGGEGMATRLVTVFGGSGFIGRHVVKRLAGTGALVRAAVRRPERALFLKPMGDVGQITPVAANVTDDASVRAAVEGADAVVNLVGILFQKGRQRFGTVQEEGPRRIAEAARQAGVKDFVHVSALGADANSRSVYARTKAAGEAAVRETFPDAVILRPSVVFGPQDGFFRRFAEMMLWSPFLPVFGCPPPRFAGGRLDLYGDGGTKFQPVYVGDVADAVMRGLTVTATRGRTYELGGPRIYSFVEIMRLVLRETNRRRLIVPIPFWAGSLIGLFAELLPAPPLTRDQVTLLKSDNVVSEGSLTLAALGIEPTAAEVIIPTYLDIYRRGGRFTRGQLT